MCSFHDNCMVHNITGKLYNSSSLLTPCKAVMTILATNGKHYKNELVNLAVNGQKLHML